jgi:hypothetical protein
VHAVPAGHQIQLTGPDQRLHAAVAVLDLATEQPADRLQAGRCAGAGLDVAHVPTMAHNLLVAGPDHPHRPNALQPASGATGIAVGATSGEVGDDRANRSSVSGYASMSAAPSPTKTPARDSDVADGVEAPRSGLTDPLAHLCRRPMPAR